MNRTLLVTLSFAAGGLLGSLASIYGTKTYFETKANDRADAEIESMKEFQKKRLEEIETVTNERIEKRAYELLTEKYAKREDEIIAEKKEREGEEMPKEKRPYTIDPSEYGDLDYTLVSLIYYEDGVLTYEDDQVIKNVDEMVGRDSLTQFGVFEEDAVYVRNDELRKDFEILADSRKYSDIYC